jgi:phosphoheptose isomerase
MTRFPSQKLTTIAEYFDGYSNELTRASATVSRQALDRAQALVLDCIERDGTVIVCGNGGSAAIANHLVCDFGKGMRSDTGLRPRVRSLSSGPEILTAIGNDMSYADTFSHQLDGFGRAGDLLITVSSSGDSENIVRAVNWAKGNGVASIAMTGFGGGRSAGLADVNLHVASENYGVVEDLHQSLMHVLAQFIRQSLMPDDLVRQRKF